MLPAALGEDLYCLSIDTTWSSVDHTAKEGPIVVGVAHGDLSVTEIKEATEAEMTDPDDIIARERARRPVRTIGVFDGETENEKLNDGRMLRTKMKFSVGDGHQPVLWAKNKDTAQLTTGTLIKVNGVLYGRWQR